MKYRFFYIQLVFLIVLNLILFNFPLTNILGYEFSVINSILINYISGLFVIRLLRFKIHKDKEEYNIFLKRLIEGNVLFIVVPLLMGLTAALFIKNCSLLAGLSYYAVITLPAIVIGTSLGLISYYISARFPKTIMLVLFFFTLALPLYELYFYPQIYFYNPILAYLPGTIYDEAVKIDWKLISYRFLNVIFFLSCLIYVVRVLFNRETVKIRKAFLVLMMIAVPLIFFFFSHYLGYATTQSRMKADLKEQITTEHFEIFYDESINRQVMEMVALHHEYYFSEISNYLKVSPSERTTSFIFKNSAQKKELLGTANADMAKPWLNSIFVNFENYEQTLKHEIVHSLSAEFGATIFKLGGYLNPALTEGIASAADDEYDEHSIHFMAALANKNGYKINIPKLFKGLSFFGQVSGLSYIFAGSFSKFLIDKYGVEKFKRVYSGDDFFNAYKKEISSLENEYYKFLDDYPGYNTKAMADYYFGRLTIFRKPCARYAAEQIGEGWKKLNKGNYEEARKEFEKLFKETDSYTAFSGYVNSLILSNNYNSAYKLILENQDKYINTAYYFSTGLILADAAVKLGRYDLADSVYKSIIEKRPSKSLVYISLLRRDLLKDTSIINEYISGDDREKYSILRRMNYGNPNYITIPVLINLAEEYNMRFDSLMQIADNFVVSDSISSYSAYKLSEYALRHNEFCRAKQLAEKAAGFSGDSQKLMESNLKRINWLIRNSGSLSKNIKQNAQKPERKI